MMRALADHTRLSPEGRIQRLEQFSERMRKNKKIVEELKKWDMELAQKLVEFPGRVLPTENIIQGQNGGVKYSAGQDTDWTKSLRSNQMLSLGQLNVWAVVCPVSLKRDSYNFVQSLQKVAQGMGMRIPMPKL